MQIINQHARLFRVLNSDNQVEHVVGFSDNECEMPAFIDSFVSQYKDTPWTLEELILKPLADTPA